MRKKKRDPKTHRRGKRHIVRGNRKKAKRLKEIAVEIRKNGAPSSYDPIFAEQAKQLTDMGATEAELAAHFHVTIVTIAHWKNRHQDFFRATQIGKDAADERVKQALYHKARGYTFDSVKIFCTKDGDIIEVPIQEHVPPSDKAIELWLTNRRPQEWKNRQYNEFDPDQPLKIKVEGGLPTT